MVTLYSLHPKEDKKKERRIRVNKLYRKVGLICRKSPTSKDNVADTEAEKAPLRDTKNQPRTTTFIGELSIPALPPLL